jgi:tetratricopeptide (TPR) repeat protein
VGVPNTSVPKLFHKIQRAFDEVADDDEGVPMKKVNANPMQGKNIEESIRKAIRKLLEGPEMKSALNFSGYDVGGDSDDDEPLKRKRDINLADKSDPSRLTYAQLAKKRGELDAKKSSMSPEELAAATRELDDEDPLIIAQWVESLSTLGMVTARLDLLVEAEQKLLKATELFPDDPDLWHAYGICLIAMGRYYEDPDYYEYAIEKLQYGLSIDRSDPELWHALGIAHKFYAELTQDADLIERANRFFSRAIDLKPACPALLHDAATGLLLFSDILDDLPSLEQSILLFEQLLQTFKEAILHHPEWLFNYASALQWLL